MRIERTTSDNKGFQALCSQLDDELNTRNGKGQSVYDQFNKIENNDTVLVGYQNEQPIASGCFKKLDKQTVEIKRMFVMKAFRRKGFSSQLLQKLEEWAKELNFSFAVLETGKGQTEAIALYRKRGYEIVENYDPYIGIENSVCMKKKLTTQIA